MATTRLTDAIIPEVYLGYQTLDTPELDAFWRSGVVQYSGLLETFANAGGSDMTVPYWGDLNPNDEPNYSNDDPAQHAVPLKIGSGSFRVRTNYLNQGWSAMDLVNELAGSNPMRRIRSRTDAYWRGVRQRRLISTSLGILNDNVANDGGDMVYNIATEDGANATAANLFSRTAFTGAVFTLGDQFGGIQAIAMHSMVYKRLIDEDEKIEEVYDSQGNLIKSTYYGKEIVIDDSMPVIAGTTSGFKYVSVLYGRGAFGFGTGTPLRPVSVAYSDTAGNGGGQETLWERKTYILHPAGFDNTGAVVSGGANASTPPAVAYSQTLANLQNAANWDRKWHRKQVRMAFLITNG